MSTLSYACMSVKLGLGIHDPRRWRFDETMLLKRMQRAENAIYRSEPYRSTGRLPTFALRVLRTSSCLGLYGLTLPHVHL